MLRDRQRCSSASRRLCIAIAALLLWPVLGLDVLTAQQQPAQLRLHRLEPGQLVRVRTVEGPRIESAIESIASDPFVLRLEQPRIPLALDAIDSLWVRDRATSTGALVGAVVLGSAQLAFWGYFCANPGYERNCGTEVTAGMTAAGLATGALIGAGVGHHIPRWRLRYARDAGDAADRTPPRR